MSIFRFMSFEKIKNKNSQPYLKGKLCVFLEKEVPIIEYEILINLIFDILLGMTWGNNLEEDLGY